MDKLVLREHLATAERHVLESERRVKEQQRIVEQLERDGHATEMARKLLEEFERSLELHRQGWTLIREELGEDPGVAH